MSVGAAPSPLSFASCVHINKRLPNSHSQVPWARFCEMTLSIQTYDSDGRTLTGKSETCCDDMWYAEQICRLNKLGLLTSVRIYFWREWRNAGNHWETDHDASVWACKSRSRWREIPRIAVTIPEFQIESNPPLPPSRLWGHCRGMYSITYHFLYPISSTRNSPRYFSLG